MNSTKLKNYLDQNLPPSMYRFLKQIHFYSIKKVTQSTRSWYLRRKIARIEEGYEKILEQKRAKAKLKVLFLLLISDSWKYDSLYKKFEEDEKYEAIVVICPFVTQGEDFLLKDLKKSEAFCLEKKYNYLLGYDVNEKKVVDIKKLIDPDIVFFSNPNNLTADEFLIDNFFDTLTCYVPYTFQVDALYEYRFNSMFTNKCWRVFYETELHKKYSENYSLNRGKNVIVTGHPFLNVFNNNSGIDPWKKTDSIKRKRIIWGPHWTVKGGQFTGLNFSCFLEYADYFLELAEKYNNEVQFALKPHPFLKMVLRKPEIWGEEKTAKYFKRWDEMPNTQLLEGEFVQLFKYSDALVHDSSAFLAEYHLLDKPSAYTVFDNQVFDNLNDFGINSIKVHIQIKSKYDLNNFIVDIINGVDKKKQERKYFVEKFYFRKQHTASENIKEYISKQLLERN